MALNNLSGWVLALSSNDFSLFSTSDSIFLTFWAVSTMPLISSLLVFRRKQWSRV